MSKYTAKPVLVVGATGYIGGRLTPMLLDRGYNVRVAVRSPQKISCRSWGRHPNLEIAAADVLDAQSMREACKGAGAVFYLVHSMNPTAGNFADADRKAAENMRSAAHDAQIERIIYLGGLGEDSDNLSHHLQSRHEVGRILSSGPVPCTWLRAAMILGAGSASFEILRYLVERLPVMLTPRWVRNKCQPIAVSNVLGYLLGCLEQPDTTGQKYDIGGPDIMTYEEIFQIYAAEAGLNKRIIIPVPVLSPKLSSYWIHLVTPVPASIARPLAEGLRNEVICKEENIKTLVSQNLLSVRQAIRRALDNTAHQEVGTCWHDAGTLHPPEWLACGDAPYAGGTVLECNHTMTLACTPEQVWRVLRRIGGENGWFYGNALWKVRGFADRLAGGVGLRRGRRHPSELRVGDSLDFWRVLALEDNKRLLLLAEMKMPGEAVLQFLINPLPATRNHEHRVELLQISRFLPKGLAGLMYWYALAPAHGLIFKGMLKGIAKQSGCPVLQEPKPFSHGGHMCTLSQE